MKRIATSTMIVFLTIVSFMLTSCGRTPILSFNDFSIDSWDDLQGIGAGYVTEGSGANSPLSNNSVAGVLTVDDENEVGHFRLPGEIEDYIPTMHLLGITILESFTFVNYAVEGSMAYENMDHRGSIGESFDGMNLIAEEGTHGFAISMKTGNVFWLNDRNVGMNLHTASAYDETPNALFFIGKPDMENDHTLDYIFKMYEDNDELIITGMINLRETPKFNNFTVDNHGNIFARQHDPYTRTFDITHVYRSELPDGETQRILELDYEGIFRAANGYMYAEGMVFNEYGLLEETDFFPSTKINPSGVGRIASGNRTSFRVASDGNTFYYFLAEPTTGQIGDNDYENIHVFTFEDCGIVFTYRTVSIESRILSSNFIILNESINFLYGGNVYSVCVRSGDKDSVTDAGIESFTNLSSDGVTNLIFTATSIMGTTINGTINSALEVGFDMPETNYNVTIMNQFRW